MKTVFLLLKLNKLFGSPNMQTLEGNPKKKKKIKPQTPVETVEMSRGS